MTGLVAETYSATDREAWDAFVRDSRNGTFLFERDYVEYHANRFTDASRVIRDDKRRLVALLPASIKNEVVTSHGGLTYGGLVCDASMTMPGMLHAFEALLANLKASGAKKFVYRPVPVPYHRSPAQEDLVAMFLLDARLTRRSALAISDQQARLPFQERRRRGVKRATAAGVTVREHEDLVGYWELLTNVLRETHGSAPVHTLDEITKLRARFPANVRLFGAFQNEVLIAGVLIYETHQVARSQYIAAGPLGKDVAALDLVFHVLLNEVFASKRYFDFGTSERDGARRLQTGLLEQKEGFGARVVPQDQYEIDLEAWRPGALLESLA